VEKEKCMGVTEWAVANCSGPGRVTVDVGDDSAEEPDWSISMPPESALALALQLVNSALEATGDDRRVTRLLGMTEELADELDSLDDDETPKSKPVIVEGNN
jgi:hypothetical protein